MLGEITPVGRCQADWFEPVQTADTRWMDALDGLNQRFGRRTVKVSIEGSHKGWSMRLARKSTSYKTDWGGVPIV